MQKISSYLYPNRINVVADVTLFPVRWNIVYQNRIKLYQGVDNVLTLDVKNSDQKRIDISEMILKMTVMDTAGKEILIADVTPTDTIGLATISVPADDLAELSPQFLSFTIYRENEDDTKTVLYADTQFGAVGKMELLGSAVSVSTPERYITRFNLLSNKDDKPEVITWYSDAVEIRKPNFIQAASADAIELDFKFNKSDAVVTVQFTQDEVVNAYTEWTDALSFGVFPSDTSATKTISNPTYNRDYAWMRVKFIQTTYNGTGATVNISKVDGGTTYTFLEGKPGKGYRVGETFTVNGLRLGGPATSPNGSWLLTVAAVDGLGGVTEWTPLAEMPVFEGSDVYYKDIPVRDDNHIRTIDRVTIRL